jgi:sulfate adenylyltransferase
MDTLELNRAQYLELEKLGLGAFLPVDGFMNEDCFHSVVNGMRLPDGSPFTLPIVLDADAETAKSIQAESRVALYHSGVHVGDLMPESVYAVDKAKAAVEIYGTDSIDHPGVRFFYEMGDWFIGGKIELLDRVDGSLSAYEMTPAETRALFQSNGWKTITGFQTRNAPHRAHEYLQRVALEVVDGLFVQPLVGKRKLGDYTPEAIIKGYSSLISEFYPKDRVALGLLTTSMRYAGPREAVFHAIVRRNYGCTHFIVGRDHAGVGSYYGKYEAHDLTRCFEGELGITVMRLCGPFYCSACDSLATEKTCQHYETSPQNIMELAGTDMRAILSGGGEPKPHLMRPEIINALRDTPLFVEDESI